MYRPSSTAGRPTTSSGGLTFNPYAFEYHNDDPLHHPIDEDDDESDDGDGVFAFLPPTTSDGQPHPPDPIYDPHARFPAESPRHLYPPPTAQSPPPSTDSNTSNPYQLKHIHVSLPNTPEKDGYKMPSTPSRKHPPGSGKTDPSEDYDEYEEYDDDDDLSSREGSIKMEFDFDAIEEEDSPFPEVRASVSNVDDPEMPALTIRMWVVGLSLTMLSGALNVFFNFRSPSPTLVPLALLLISYPFGKFLAYALPITTYRLPLPSLPAFLLPALPKPRAPLQPQASLSSRILYSIQGFPSSLKRLFHNFLVTFVSPSPIEFSLNPGPWNIKEHVLVFIMANVCVGNPYALNAIVVAEHYYGLEPGYWFSVVLVLATQMTGFGLAGLTRRFLVWPASMVWPQNLVACTLLYTLHAEEDSEEMLDDASTDADGFPSKSGKRRRGIFYGVSRYRWFCIVAASAFFWFFLPGYLFKALSIFSFVCWAVPDNVPVNQLFGVYSGLGMSVITFDWAQISWIGSPLMFPWWAQCHIFGGFVLFYWILTPILYYTNSWKLAYFPMTGNIPYDNTGKPYDITKVLTTQDTFDSAAYENYSPLYLPATYAVCYLIAFTLSTCVITHTLLYHGKSLLKGFRRIQLERDDVHVKLMRSYREVPDWWYLMATVCFFSLAVVAVEVWHTGVPVWALILSLILPTLYILPSGFIYAMTGQGITLNILAQIIPGTLLPGNPMANMVFKAYSVQTLTEATSFVQDLKLGHYIKLPPRATFTAQFVATTLAAFVQVGVKTFIFANVPDICSPSQKDNLTCPHNEVFFTASALWGLIGPSRQFGPQSVYHPHLYALAVGAVLPLPFFFFQKRYPQSWVKYISTPVILNGVSAIPPAVGINYSNWFLVGFIFQYLIRKRYFAWWSKFNYITSAALDSGTAVSLIFIILAFQFPRGGKGLPLNWWGNTVFKNTADYKRLPLLPIPESGKIA